MKNKTNKAEARTLPCGKAIPHGRLRADELKTKTATLVEKLESFCKERQLKKSGARRKILEVIVSGLDHFTSQELGLKLSQKFPEVGRATLYRTLPVLVEAGILQEGPKASNGLPSYELVSTHHHDHIVCLDCHAVFEFANAKIEREQETLSAEMGFAPRRHTHVIYAHCSDLDRNKAGKRTSRPYGND